MFALLWFSWQHTGGCQLLSRIVEVSFVYSMFCLLTLKPWCCRKDDVVDPRSFLCWPKISWQILHDVTRNSFATLIWSLKNYLLRNFHVVEKSRWLFYRLESHFLWSLVSLVNLAPLVKGCATGWELMRLPSDIIVTHLCQFFAIFLSHILPLIFTLYTVRS